MKIADALQRKGAGNFESLALARDVSSRAPFNIGTLIFHLPSGTAFVFAREPFSRRIFAAFQRP
jgi:hypothetical protein